MLKNKFLVNFSIWIIRELWQKRLGKWHNKKRNVLCRFYPSCSRYTILALKKYGFTKGWKLSFNRLKRCRPDNVDSCYDVP
ncbi:membrane protein insertion efficiency factor YidD [Candidatus Woesearchaeota archaeon]|nr:membrane protein insertion efficiency factor YidD [Candidatus Woesearchaeota archaeon]